MEPTGSQRPPAVPPPCRESLSGPVTSFRSPSASSTALVSLPSPSALLQGPNRQEIIASGKADLVALARAMLYDPRWGWHAAAELGATVDAPPPYWRAPPHEHKSVFGNTTYGAR